MNKLLHVRTPKNSKELVNIVKAQRIAEQVLKDTLAILKSVELLKSKLENFIKAKFYQIQSPNFIFLTYSSFQVKFCKYSSYSD